jgi:hypothetical protein
MEKIYFDPKKNKHQVPQGSILGPILLLLYKKNDLLKNIQGAKAILFSDNINMLVMAEEVKTLQHTLIGGVRRHTSCRLVRDIHVLPVACLYIL